MLTRVQGLPLWKPFEARPFRLLWSGTGLSMLADQAFLVALTWLVLQVAGAGAGLGAVLAVASVPGTVLTPLGGVMSDRFSPARVMILASAGRVLLLAALAALVLSDATRLWHVYVLAGGLSALDALYYPASMAIVPAPVDCERLGAANALAQGVEQVSSILGPALAGAMISLLGLGGAGAFATLVAVAGAGSLAGAAAAGSAGSLRRRGLLVLALTATLGVIVGSVAFVPNLPVAAALAFGIGGAAGFLGVVNISWLQERSEPHLTGRVMSLAMFAAVSLDPLSFVLAGLLTELGLAVVFLSAGGLLVITALLGAASGTVRRAE